MKNIRSGTTFFLTRIYSEYDFYFISWSEKMYISFVPSASWSEKNVYFIRAFGTHEIYIFHFTRWNKSHIHDKHLNILYIYDITKFVWISDISKSIFDIAQWIFL